MNPDVIVQILEKSRVVILCFKVGTVGGNFDYLISCYVETNVSDVFNLY